MNFKPNIFKLILSLLVGVFVGCFRLLRIRTGIEFNSTVTFILFFLIGFILVYVLWSLVQKKK